MDSELEYFCEQLRLLIVELEPAMPHAEWVETGFLLADVIAMMRSLEAERAFWAEPEDEEDEGGWILE